MKEPNVVEKACNCISTRKVYSPIIIINNNHNIINNNTVTNNINNNYGIKETSEKKSFPTFYDLFKQTRETKNETDENQLKYIETFNHESHIVNNKFLGRQSNFNNERKCSDFIEGNKIETISLEIIENMKDDLKPEIQLEILPQFSIFKNNSTIFKKNMKCLKDFQIKEEVLDIEDMHLLENKRPRNKELNHENFENKECWKKCGDFMVCPELLPQKCQKFQNGECECSLKCRILEATFKSVNNVKF